MRMPSRRSLLVVGSITIALLASIDPLRLLLYERQEKPVVEHIRDFMRAQQSFANRNGGYFGTLECLSQPADCIPGFEGPPFLDPALATAELVNGYRLDFYSWSYSGSKIHTFAYVAIPVSRWLKDRVLCGSANGSIYVLAHDEEGHGRKYCSDDPIFYTPEWPVRNWRGGECVPPNEAIVDCTLG